MRHKIKKAVILLLFCILLPYMLAVFTGTVGDMQTGFCEEGISVIDVSGSGRQKIPETFYLIGAMAASVPDSMPDKMQDEMLKAQAVVLRTNLYAAYLLEGDKTDRSVENRAIGQTFLTAAQMRALWGEEYETQYERCKQAVEQTKGQIMTYGGIPIKAPYFYVSAGTTRDGAEALGEGNYPYLAAAECPQDMLCPKYSVKYTYSERVFWEKLRDFLTSQESKKTEERNVSEFALKRDSAGYVLTMTDEASGHTYAGEALRACFDLPSSCFDWKQEKGKVEIVVKGQGHGIGMSQFCANELAKQGKGYIEILETFFLQIKLQKNE